MTRSPGPDPPARLAPAARRWGRAAAVLLLGAVLVAVAWAAWQHVRDPVAGLDHELRAVGVLRDSAYRGRTASGEKRLYRDLWLVTTRAGTVRITTSRPASAASGELPLALVLGGQRTGRDALDFVPRHGSNVLAAYQYPGGGDRRFEGAGLTDAPAIRRAILRVPAQVRAAATYLRSTPGIDASRTSLLGYSLGALFVPAAQRRAAEHDTPFDALVMAYGGADLTRLAHANLEDLPAPLRWLVSRAVGTALRPVEPALHLPHLTGDLLILQGTGDRRIPEASARQLIRLAPEPKEVVRLEGAHMGPGRDEVNARVVRRSQAWLAPQGHVVPPPTAPPAVTAAAGGG